MNNVNQLYSSSHHLYNVLDEIQRAIEEDGQYYIGLQSLFNFVEQYFRVKTGDYSSQSRQLYTKCYALDLITECDYKYLNDQKNSFRVLRNAFMHRNVYLTYIIDLRSHEKTQYPLSEDSTIKLIAKNIFEDVKKIIGQSNIKRELLFPFEIIKIEPIDLAKEFGLSEIQYTTMYNAIYNALIEEYKIKTDISFAPFESDNSLKKYTISILIQQINNSIPVNMVSSIINEFENK